MKSIAVHRKEAVLVTPAAPTPHEFKDLSDIDDQEGLRFQIPFIHFYRDQPPATAASDGVVDPVAAIKVALSRALVHYYPFAGRLREGPGRKLSVECTGEGVLFVEADADTRLDELGSPLRPPFPYLDELLADVEGSGDVLGCPLLLIQVTRLMCGGFVFALRHNHTMSDAQGLAQFLGCLAELSRGASEPSVEPVWAREVLCASVPPRQPRFRHREYDELLGTVVPFEGMEHRSFFFGKREIAAMRSHTPPNLGSSTFEILTACLWRSRTIAIAPDPEEEVRMICIANARSRLNIGSSPRQLPEGYYGNALAFPVAVSTAGMLCGSPVGYAVELVKGAKAEVSPEYFRSTADLIVLRGRQQFAVVRSFLVSDVTKVGFSNIDFGWGKAVYAGPAKGGVGAVTGFSSFYIPQADEDGEDGIVIPVCLPSPAMERFAVEMEKLMTEVAPATT